MDELQKTNGIPSERAPQELSNEWSFWYFDYPKFWGNFCLPPLAWWQKSPSVPNELTNSFNLGLSKIFKRLQYSCAFLGQM
jgi:hypothetical protein